MKSLALSAVLSLALVSNAWAGVVPTINEINYDNDGTDNTEYVEIYAPGGGDYSAFALVFYNGAAASLAEYLRVNLGTIPGDGFLVIGNTGVPNLDITIAGNIMQNGAPDGLAIVETGVSCVETLAYEGMFTGHATNGAECASILFPDIGVSDVDPANAAGEVILQNFPDGSGSWFATSDGADAGIFADGTPGVTNTPEPSTIALLLLGGLVALRRRQ